MSSLSIKMLLLTARQPGSWVFTTTAIAFACLVADMVITLKANEPINAMVNAYVLGGGNTDWEATRIKWLNLVGYRGLLNITGMLSLVFGLVMERRR